MKEHRVTLHSLVGYNKQMKTQSWCYSELQCVSECFHAAEMHFTTQMHECLMHVTVICINQGNSSYIFM